MAGQGGIVTLFVALAGTIVWRLVDNRLSRNRDELLHRTRVNSPLTLGPPRAGEIVKIHSRRGPEIVEPSLVVLRVKKAGPKALSHDSFDGSLTFIFDGRTVEAAEATEASPHALAGLVSERLRYRNHPNPELRADSNGEEIPADQLRIPSFVINQDERFNLLVLLSGTGSAIRSDGHILGARIRDDTGRQLKATRRTVAGGLALLLAGALGVALVFTYGRPFSPAPADCRSGNLTVAGSSAFGSIANQVAESYAATCTNAHITVLEPGSLQGAQDLVAAGANARDTRLALTDGTVPYQGLVGQPVAVILYSLVANPSVTVPNLTLEQVRGVFAGRYTNWAALGGPDLPIRIVGRDHASGSRSTLEKYVLGGNGQGALSSLQCLDKDRDASALTIVCEQKLDDRAAAVRQGHPGGDRVRRRGRREPGRRRDPAAHRRAQGEPGRGPAGVPVLGGGVRLQLRQGHRPRLAGRRVRRVPHQHPAVRHAQERELPAVRGERGHPRGAVREGPVAPASGPSTVDGQRDSMSWSRRSGRSAIRMSPSQPLKTWSSLPPYS